VHWRRRACVSSRLSAPCLVKNVMKCQVLVPMYAVLDIGDSRSEMGSWDTIEGRVKSCAMIDDLIVPEVALTTNFVDEVVYLGDQTFSVHNLIV